MKAKYLFPPVFRIIGIIMAAPGFILGYLNVFQRYDIPGFALKLREENGLFTPAIENFTDELALALVIMGLVFIAFSRIRHEDELTGKLRLNALYWAILFNYSIYGIALLIAGQIKLFDVEQLTHWLEPVITDLRPLVYNLFLPLLIFIARFYYLLYKDHNTYELRAPRFLSHRPYSFIGKLLSVGVIVTMVVIPGMDSFSLIWFLPYPLLLWAYSRERNEDEYISTIRLDAMQIAVYTNYAVLMLANVFCYSITFLLVLSLNLVTIPSIFLLVFYFRLWRLKRQIAADKHLTLGVL